MQSEAVDATVVETPGVDEEQQLDSGLWDEAWLPQWVSDDAPDDIEPAAAFPQDVAAEDVAAEDVAAEDDAAEDAEPTAEPAEDRAQIEDAPAPEDAELPDAGAADEPSVTEP